MSTVSDALAAFGILVGDEDETAGWEVPGECGWLEGDEALVGDERGMEVWKGGECVEFWMEEEEGWEVVWEGEGR